MKQTWIYFQIIFLFSIFVFSEEYKQVKVLNGFDSSCDKQNESQINNNRPIAINVLDVKKQSSSTMLKLELVFVKCEKNKWTASNQQNFSYEYTDSLGQKINESVSFSKYELQIIGKNEVNIFSSNLKSNSDNKFTFNIKVPTKDSIADNQKEAPRFVELYLKAEKTRQNAADIEPSTVNWGKIKISI